MKKDIRLKAVVFYSIIILAAIITADIFLEPSKYLNISYLYSRFDKIMQKQNVAVQRIYINVWRTARNEYVDSSMNNQNWARWRNRYLKHIKTMEDADVAINTMLLSLNDPYCRFLKPALYKKQENIMDSKVTGIGLIISNTEDGLVVNNIIDNSPAQKSSVQKGDIILSIDGKDTVNNKITDIISSENFIKENNVSIKIKRDNKIIEKTIRKTDIPIDTMKYRILKNNIGYIKIYTIMGEKTVNDFKDIIEKTNKTNALIIDLRNNYGGVLVNAVEMANYMLDNERIVTIQSRSDGSYQIYANGENIFNKKPIIILVNDKTASAAEIFAGCMHDNNNALIIGERTYGKNTIQEVIPMHNDTGLVVTTGKYILPSGKDIHNKGLEPDIYIPDKKNKKDELLKEALKIADGLVKKSK